VGAEEPKVKMVRRRRRMTMMMKHIDKKNEQPRNDRSKTRVGTRDIGNGARLFDGKVFC